MLCVVRASTPSTRRQCGEPAPGSGRPGIASNSDGGFPRYIRRRLSNRVCSLADTAQGRAHSLGAGSFVSLSGGPALPCRAWDIPAGSPCRTQKTCRRLMGVGRRPAVLGALRRHRRNMGRPCRSRLHGNQAPGNACRSQWCSGLADTPVLRSQSECCTRALAYCRHAVFPPPRRCTGPRSAPLAPGALPLTLAQAWCLGCQL